MIKKKKTKKIINSFIRRGKKNYTDPHEPRHVSLNSAQSSKSFEGILKIVSYNIKHSKNIKKAISLLDSQEELHHADAICLQEMDPDGVNQIAKELKYNYVYYPAVLHPKYKKDFGNAILTKWPIIGDKKIILPFIEEDHMQRIAISTTILVNKQEVMLFCIHMKVFLKPKQRAEHAQHILNEIPPSIRYCIIAGDFNTYSQANRKALMDTFSRADFECATKGVGWTFKHWYLANKKSALDHIFARGMKIVDKGKVNNRVPSDHLPIWVQLTFN